VRVLVTGASGFLGSYAARALADRGHDVRALVRRAGTAPGGSEEVVADLRSDDLTPALEGVDAVVHLAAVVTGGDEERFVGTVPPTELLLEAMGRTGVRRLVLVSSYSVYDWSRANGVLDESCPVEETRLYERDGYVQAKVWQERVARRAASHAGGELVVLRPGFVWGPGRTDVSAAGVPAGPLQLVVAPTARLPLTYVENCADCIARAVESRAATGGTFNVVDGAGETAWRCAREWRPDAIRVPVPYALGLAIARLAQAVSRALFRSGGRLPSVLVPRRFEARFRPLRHTADAAGRVLGWEPRVEFDEALRRSRGD
jgi:UDP-glucose 4-epimerase